MINSRLPSANGDKMPGSLRSSPAGRWDIEAELVTHGLKRKWPKLWSYWAAIEGITRSKRMLLCACRPDAFPERLVEAQETDLAGYSGNRSRRAPC